VVERHDLMSAYYRRLTGTDHEEKMKCAKAWTTWEMSIGTKTFVFFVLTHRVDFV
jgi:hypothetical protein